MSNHYQNLVITYLENLIENLEELQKDNRGIYYKYLMIEKDLETLNEMLNRYSL